MTGMYSKYLKRVCDIVFSVASLILISWLFVLILLCYVVCREFPVFFSQKRIGRDGLPFTILKFRTLSNKIGAPLLERQFPLGKLLRSTNLDELPQLLNVLIGDMSIVGPRPLPIGYLPLFSSWQSRRHQVRPGITGWAQVRGRHSISWPEKFRLDIHYIDNLSIALDLKIVMQTFTLLLTSTNDTSLRERPFTGEQ